MLWNRKSRNPDWKHSANAVLQMYVLSSVFKEYKRQFKEAWIKEIVRDTDTGPCIPTVCMIRAASPFFLRHEAKGESVSVADSM